MPESSKIKIGVSSCLQGAMVRFDGGHKRDAYINDVLGRYFDFLPVCPEVDSGMGVPREPVRLIRRNDGKIEVIGQEISKTDVTSVLTKFSRSRIPELRTLRGYLVKGNSPSCGMVNVRIYTQQGKSAGSRAGIFTSVLMQRYPLLPVEEEGRICDPLLRDNFIERVFVYDRWLSVVESGLSPDKLVDFHTRHKLLIMSHNQAALRRLDCLVAQVDPARLGEITQSYSSDLMKTLKRPATRKKHVNVLRYLLGYLKKCLNENDKLGMQEILEQYETTQLPLIVPLTLFRHHFHRHPNSFVGKQVYFFLHLHELMSRNCNN